METKVREKAVYKPVEQMLDTLIKEYKLSCFNSKNDLSALYNCMIEFKSEHGGLASFQTENIAIQLAIEKYLQGVMDV